MTPAQTRPFSPARLRTMRQAIAWSDDLLSAAERSLFRRFAIFSGGFTLDAAEYVEGRWSPSRSVRQSRRCTPSPRDIPCTGALCNRTPCNQAVCGRGEYCCNPSCGTCAPLDGDCHQAIRDPYDPPLEECGHVACPAGQVCCNASCGICTPPGGACVTIAYEDNPVR